MTSKDRDTLLKIAAKRARVARSLVAQRSAQLLADYEEQSSAIYSARDEAWAEVVGEARARLAEADAEIAERCRERGIPKEFRPRLASVFLERGQNSERSRRVELRKLAERQIDAAAKAARLEIERADAEVQVELLAGSLTTDEARAVLERLPSAEQLMPAVQLEQQVPRRTPMRELWS